MLAPTNELTSVFKLPGMLTTVDIDPIGSVGSNGPEWRGMRPRNRRHVSVLMIGVRPISSSSSAQVWAPRMQKGKQAGLLWWPVTRGSLCELAWQGAQSQHDDAWTCRSRLCKLEKGGWLVDEGWKWEMKMNKLQSVAGLCFRDGCADDQPPLNKSWWRCVRQS